jgi:hypothetical protein
MDATGFAHAVLALDAYFDGLLQVVVVEWGGDAGGGIGTEWGELRDGGRRKAADFRGGKAEKLNHLRQGRRIGASPQGKGLLNGLMVEVSIHERVA